MIDQASNTETGVVPGLTRHRNMRSRYRCSMCPAIHINSHSWLCSSSIHEPSDPPLRAVCFGDTLPLQLGQHSKVETECSTLRPIKSSILKVDKKIVRAVAPHLGESPLSILAKHEPVEEERIPFAQEYRQSKRFRLRGATL